MKIFPAAFTTQKNRTDGAHPIWILRLTVSGVDYWLCDNAITIPACTGATPWPSNLAVNTLAWVKSWGTIQEGISGALGEFHVADFGLMALIDPTANPNMETLATSGVLEQNPVELYEWFYGCSDPPQRIFKGRVRDVDNLTDTSVDLSVQDESILLEKFFIGQKLSATYYPEASDADIGKIIPIAFGPVLKSPTIALTKYCLQTVLSANCGAGNTTLYFGNTDVMFAGMELLIGTERVRINSVASGSATVTRGYSGTTALAHSNGTSVVSLVTYVHIASARSVTSLPRVWLRLSDGVDIDVTAHCTRYTGQPGNQCTGFGGMAVILFDPDQTIAIMDIIQLRQQDTIGVATGSHDHATESSRTQACSNAGITYNGGSSLSEAPTYPAVSGEIEETNTIDFAYGGDAGTKNVYVAGQLVNSGASSNTSVRWSGTTVGTPIIRVDGSAATSIRINSATRVVTFNSAVAASPADGVAKTGSAQMSGSSGTGYFGTGKILADMTADSGDLVGISNYILAQAGFPPLQVIGDLPAGNAPLAGLIDEYRTALYWLNLLAFQCGCWFAVSNGAPRAIVRQIGAVKYIPACIISEDGRRQLTRKKTDFADLITTITVLYVRDWSSAKSASAYQKTYLVPGSTGTDERPELFQFDFATDPAMVATVGALYLAWYCVRHWLAEFSIPLQYSELEFGDAVALGFLAGQAATIIAAEHAPGSYDRADMIKLTALY